MHLVRPGLPVAEGARELLLAPRRRECLLGAIRVVGMGQHNPTLFAGAQSKSTDQAAASVRNQVDSGTGECQVAGVAVGDRPHARARLELRLRAGVVEGGFESQLDLDLALEALELCAEAMGAANVVALVVGGSAGGSASGPSHALVHPWAEKVVSSTLVGPR